MREEEEKHYEALPPSMSAEEFLSWCDTTAWAEWVDGQVVTLPREPWLYHELRDFLMALVRIFVEQHELGIAVSAPFPIWLGQELSIRMPDLFFLTREHREQLRETHLEGPPDMIVEIVSPESGPRDRGEKFYEYEEAGVYEYWLIDPTRHQAEFYRLQDNGYYQWVFPDAMGVFRSEAVPDFTLKIEWLWQESRPTLVSALRELKLI